MSELQQASTSDIPDNASNSKRKMFCITESRCRLCRFDMWKTWPAKNQPMIVQYGARIARIAFESFWSCYGNDLSVQMCLNRYCMFLRFHGRRAAHFHVECYKFVSEDKHGFAVDTGFLAATDYLFEPSQQEERRRIDFLRQFCVERLRDNNSPAIAGLKKLPMEVCSMIASMVHSEFAIALADLNWVTRPGRSADGIVDLSTKVYAQYVSIDGVIYLQSLGETDIPGSKLRFNGSSSLRPSHVDIGSDHLGVRCLRFTSSQEEKTAGDVFDAPAEGLWWKRISRSEGVLKLEVQTDGLKIRDIKNATEPENARCICTEPALLVHNDMSFIRWSIPGISVDGTTATVFDLATCSSPSGHSPILRMQHISCNSPAVKGYSARCRGSSIDRLLCHTAPEHANTVYEVADSNHQRRHVWIYFPVDEGEHIRTIYRMSPNDIMKKSYLGLILDTSREKTVIFGQQPTDIRQFNLLQVCDLPEAPSRIYFNVPESTEYKEIRFMGLENAPNNRRVPYPRALVPRSPHPGLHDSFCWYYSSCSLENIAQITPCRQNARSSIVGMLVRYHNNHSIAVGQVRLDWLRDAICIEKGGTQVKLHLEMEMAQATYPTSVMPGLVVNVSIRANDVIPVEIGALDLEGELEWWFTSDFCSIRHCKGGKFRLVS